MALITGSRSPRTRNLSVVPSATRSSTPGTPRKPGGGNRPGEACRNVATCAAAHLLDVFDGDEPPVADDRDAVTDALDLVEVV